MNPSPNLFLIGPSGAGKTSVGRRVAGHHALSFIDLDQEIETHTGVAIATIFDIEGEAGFRQREAALLDESSQQEGIVMATGAGAVLDENSRRRLASRGFVLWLDASIEQQLQRLSRDRQRPLLAGADRRRRFAAMAAERTPLYRSIADLHIVGRSEPVTRATHRVIDALDGVWRPPSAEGVE